MSLQTMYPAEQQRLQQQAQHHEIIGCCALCIRLLEWLGIIATQKQQQQQHHTWQTQRAEYVQSTRNDVGGGEVANNTVSIQSNRQAQQCQEEDLLLPQKGESSSTPVQPQLLQSQLSTGLPDLETMRRRAAHKRVESRGSAKAKSGNIKDDCVDDCCPTCLDPYDEDNPKIVTSCGHDFHLACIYEWLNRSDNCPMCGQKMQFDELL